MSATAIATYRCHATWRDHGLHIWGWDGDRAAPAGWLLRNVLRHEHGEPATSIARLAVPVGGDRDLTVSSIRVEPASAIGWLGGLLSDRSTAPSDSLIWFGQLSVLAARLVAAGRVTPTITTERGRAVARWAPVLAELDTTIDALHRAGPPACHHGSRDVTLDALSWLVDAMCRQQLDSAGWVPPSGGRDPGSRLLHDVGRALADADPRLARHPSTELRRLGDSLRRARRRADGQRVAVARLRLDPPDNADDPWWVQLQLVDEDDAGRWCNAADVWAHTPLAVDLAGHPEHIGTLGEVALETARLVAGELPQLAQWATAEQPDEVALGLGDVDGFLDRAAHRLPQLGITLIGPERLLTGAPRVHGLVRDADEDSSGVGGRLRREAIIDWTLVVHDHDVPHRLDDASLERADSAGSRLLHSGGRWIRLDPSAVAATTARLQTLRRTKRVVGPAEVLQLAADAGAQGQPAITLEARRGWASRVLSGLGDAELEEVPAPPAFVGVLRPYQSRGLAWLRFLADLGIGGCLADDMGLGKTATAIAHLAGRPGPHLVVCPLSVVRNWQQECARFAPTMRTRVHHGAERERGHHASLFSIADDHVIITTYGVLSRDVSALASVNWSTVVLDEAQAVKHSSTNAARNVRALPAEQKLALTGTPVENRLTDLWAVLDAVNPGLLGSKRSFRDRFANRIERDNDATAAAQLRALTRPLILRRTKADRTLIPELPDKIEKIAWATLTDEQAVMYRRVVGELLVDADREAGMRRRGIVLAAITRLKQICNHPAHALGDGSRLAQRSGKLSRLDELLGEILDVDGQALVFTQYTAMGALLAQHLRTQLGHDIPFLEGSVSAGGRARMVDRFQAGRDRVLLVSLRAGGTGLNLTAASHVVHYDRWWNPAVEDQATDRAWRIGQRRTVMVHKLVTEGTVEERIASLIDDKRAVASAAVGHGDRWISELSTDELAELVRLSPLRTSQ